MSLYIAIFMNDLAIEIKNLVDGHFGHGRFGLGRFGLGRFSQAIFKGGRFGQIYIFRRFI